jgi:NADH:ubiquinone oxidoreductase subunit K
VTLLIASFYYMAAASIASALLAVTRKNPVHSMLWVLALFLHVAGIFLILSAEFLAAVQIIVYAGAILIFIFVVMLLDLPDEEARPRFQHWPLAAPRGSVSRFGWFGRAGPGRRALTRGRRTPGKLSTIWLFSLFCPSRSLPWFCWPPSWAVVITRRRTSGMIVPEGAVLGLSAVLFGIGVFGFLARRNIILMLVSIEVMLNAVNLSLAAFSRHFHDLRGQILALFVIAVAAAEVGVGLGLVIALNRNKPGARRDLTKLKW